MNKIETSPSFLKSILNIVKKRKFTLISGIFCVVLLDAVDMFPSMIIKNLINDLHHGKLAHTITYYGLSIFGCYLSIALLRMGWRHLIAFPARNTEIELRRQVFSQIFLSPFSAIKKVKPGDVVSIMSQDIPSIRMFLGPGFIVLFDALAYIIFIPITLFYILKWKSLFLLAPFILLFFLVYFLNNTMEKKHKSLSENQGKTSQHVFEEIGGVRLFRSFHLEKFRHIRYQELIKNLYEDQISIGRFDLIIDGTIQLVMMLSYIAVIYLATHQQLEGALGISVFAVSLQLLDKLTWPVSSLGHLTSLFQSAKAGISRLHLITGIKDAESRGELIPDWSRDIKIEKLNLIQNEKVLLKDINLNIKAFSKIAVIGKIGSGKSLLLEVLAGLYDRQELEYSQFTLGNEDFFQLDKIKLQEKISYIPQVPQLFSTTLEKNIILHKNPHSKILEDVLTQAELKEDLENWERREKTFIGEKGVNLSGGQKQRVLIARNLFQENQFLLWDDVISGLDPITEGKIIDFYLTQKNTTFILATHRISVLKNFEHILVMDKGRLVEEGSYEELNLKSDVFGQLVQEEELRSLKEGQWIQ